MATRQAPRPKRAGENFARSHQFSKAENDAPTSKKPRFDIRNPSALAPDAPEEDAVLELDEIGKGGQGTKRNAVNLDGYDSDSENEGFDARVEAKGKKEKAEVEEEADMFADLEEQFKDGDEDEDEETCTGKKSKGKEVRFLEEEEIEGQVAGSKSGGHVSADFSVNGNGINARKGKGFDRTKVDKEESTDSEVEVGEQEVDEEVGAGGLKSHAPKLDAFNMKGELEEGRFDASGNYVRKAGDSDAVHDSWLEGVSKRDMKRAAEAAEKRDDERRAQRLKDDQMLTSDILGTLISTLKKGETVLEALARLGKGRDRKPKWQNKKNRKKNDADEMDVDPHKIEEDPAETKRRETVEDITAAANQLLTRGQTEIYEAEREMLIRQYRRETGEDWIEPAVQDAILEEVQSWEYQWADARDGGEVHGPYEGPMMKQWQDAGFFGEGVEFRRAGNEGGDWTRIVDFT
jgi:CD2 antigen cytoplasmic tail-binding protein 2